MYGASDIFVLASHYEPFGAVIGEAMSSGLVPIVTPETGAEGDLVQNEINGLVVPPKNANALTGRADRACWRKTTAGKAGTPSL